MSPKTIVLKQRELFSLCEGDLGFDVVAVGSSRGLDFFFAYLAEFNVDYSNVYALPIEGVAPYSPVTLANIWKNLSELINLIKKPRIAFLGIGGGSVIDLVKILRYCNTHENFLNEVLAPHGKTYFDLSASISPSSELFVVPSVSGSGSEATPYAVLWDTLRGKLSFKGEALVPTGAFLSWRFIDGCGRAQTIASALDAINQIFESLWNLNSTNLSVTYCGRALPLIKSWTDDLAGGRPVSDKDMRQRMIRISWLGGKAIAITGTSICHYLSYPLTEKLSVTHGVACAVWQKHIFDLVCEERVDIALQIEELCNAAGILNLNEFFCSIDKLIAEEFTLPQIDGEIFDFNSMVSQRLKSFVVTNVSLPEVIKKLAI